MNLILLHDNDFTAPDMVRLHGRRLQHVREVHRAEVGETLTVGRLNGAIGRGEVIAVSDAALELRVELDNEPPLPLDLTLLLALPRPKMLKRVLISAVSMGVKQIWLINSYRVEKSFWGSPWLQQQKLQEVVELGLEQARDTILPLVEQRKRFRPFVEDELPALLAGRGGYVAHPYDAAPCPARVATPALLAIGPEGGFIPFEIELLQQVGLQPISFGERILRVETAVPALLSRFMAG